jgi:histidyl-tRNA synthetase
MLQNIKGTIDILPDRADKHRLAPVSYWQHIEALLRSYMQQYAYQEIRTPILESLALFARSLGQETDIVGKEMYQFSDYGEQLCLRPEGTAGCVRAAIHAGLLRNDQVQRLWYLGPMFRREQPQQGRYRQFHQFGAEVFGLSTPMIDAEQLLMQAALWQSLGLSEQLVLELNTLGDAEARAKYAVAVQDYFAPYHSLLSVDEQQRLARNPLRLLDSKNARLQELIAGAPLLTNYLQKDDQAHFEALQQLLVEQQQPYTLQPRLVRGLDYYNRTVYEWTTQALGAQATVCAGGRYDALSALLGGPSTQGAIGFAIGLERLLMLWQQVQPTMSNQYDAYLICIGQAQQQALALATQLRQLCPGIRLVNTYAGNSIKVQLQKALQYGVKYAFIIGDDELAGKRVALKILTEGQASEQRILLWQELTDFWRKYGHHNT